MFRNGTLVEGTFVGERRPIRAQLINGVPQDFEDVTLHGIQLQRRKTTIKEKQNTQYTQRKEIGSERAAKCVFQTFSIICFSYNNILTILKLDPTVLSDHQI